MKKRLKINENFKGPFLKFIKILTQMFNLTIIKWFRAKQYNFVQNEESCPIRKNLTRVLQDSYFL